jgi:cytochrome b subunit of formate dehydrogenase
MTMERGGKTVSLHVDPSAFATSAHADLECVGCHAGFSATDIPHAKKIKKVECTSCHGEDQFINFRKSVHGTHTGAPKGVGACSECHLPHAVRKISDLPMAEKQQYAVQTCARCHQSVLEKFMASDHGKAVAAGLQGAPSCIDCHGEHEVVSVQTDSALMSRPRIDRTCLKCHLDNPDVRATMGPSGAFIASYENSVHAKAVHAGNGGAATCADCHGSHEMRKGSDPRSKVSRTNIAATCGRCHPDVEAEYRQSVHGTSLAKGVNASATCTDCHGEHNILSAKDPLSPVAPKNVSARVCSPCHGSVRLTAKYGLAADRFKTFEDSFHGLAGRSGSVEVANCASCHGFHDIKPSSDPTSRLSRDNLAKTCGACHPGANQNFARGSVHVIAASSEEGLLYVISNAYIVLIAVLIGAMAFHNALDFVTKSKRQLMYRRGLLPREHHGHRLYLRMSLGERIQHGALLLSFLTLVLTGFALRFPDAWWVAPVMKLSPLVFNLRGVIHRIAAVVMVVAGIYHVYYLAFVPRGKQLLRDLLPVKQDIEDAINVLTYNLGLSQEKPLFGRFSYIEKSEYWALVWGTIVMGITGVILWFDNTFVGLLTKLWWDAARTVHYYEAWLATLAIVVWHFYFIMFNPDIYPINLAFWKGTLTEEEMAEEHPLELERIRREQKSEEAATAAAVQGKHHS